MLLGLGSSLYLRLGGASVHPGVQQCGVRLSAQLAAGSLLAGAAGVTLAEAAEAQALHPQEADFLLVGDLVHRPTLLHGVLATVAVQAGRRERARLSSRPRGGVPRLTGGSEAPPATVPTLCLAALQVPRLLPPLQQVAVRLVQRRLGMADDKVHQVAEPGRALLIPLDPSDSAPPAVPQPVRQLGHHGLRQRGALQLAHAPQLRHGLATLFEEEAQREKGAAVGRADRRPVQGLVYVGGGDNVRLAVVLLQQGLGLVVGVLGVHVQAAPNQLSGVAAGQLQHVVQPLGVARRLALHKVFEFPDEAAILKRVATEHRDGQRGQRRGSFWLWWLIGAELYRSCQYSLDRNGTLCMLMKR